MTSRSAPRRWLEHPWIFTIWCIVAAFGTYACMYGFRKPFTAGSYGSADEKALLVTAQVLGYTLSKVVGIRIIAEMPPDRRAWALLTTIAIAQMCLLGFGLTAAPLNALWLACNGLALGLVFGLVLGFVEGRRLTELFVAGLCASFIVADGVAKSVGMLVLRSGVSEPWMPAVSGWIFAMPLLLFVWMLTQIPGASADDELARSARAPMSREQRRALRRRLGTGLIGILVAYLLITILRNIRADFAPEIWHDLGLGQQAAIFTRSELWVTLAVLVANGALVLVQDNRRAFFTGITVSLAGLGVALCAVIAHAVGVLPPFSFMVLLGIGMYVPYVAVHTTIFERLIALTRERGNMAYLMYVGDAIGYLGYAAVMVVRSVSPHQDAFVHFFTLVCLSLLGAALVALLAAYASHAREWRTA